MRVPGRNFVTALLQLFGAGEISDEGAALDFLGLGLERAFWGKICPGPYHRKKERVRLWGVLGQCAPFAFCKMQKTTASPDEEAL
jgi:hypothetical protein